MKLFANIRLIYIYIYIYINLMLFVFLTIVNIPIIDDFWVLHNISQISHAVDYFQKISLLFEPHALGFGDAFFNQTEHRYVVMKLLMLLQLKLFNCINLKFFSFFSGIFLILSYFFLVKFITKNTKYNKDVILIISVVYLTPLYYMNLFWMLGFNNHLTILLGFITLFYFTNKNKKSFAIGCLSLFINLFVSHGAVIFIVISGFYLLFTKQYKYLYLYIFLFLIILSIDFYTLSNYSTIPNNNKLGINVIFSIFPVAVLLGSVALNLKISFFLGFVFMAFQLFLLKKKYYTKNPEVFCLQLYIFATCLGLAINRWQFGANYFLNSRYKYFSILLIITFILAFYEYYYSIFSKYKKIFFLITFFYFLGANVLVYKLAFQKKNIITRGYNYYLKNKVGGLYVFEEDMYDVTNKQNIQAAKIMDNLVLDKYIYIDK